MSATTTIFPNESKDASLILMSDLASSSLKLTKREAEILGYTHIPKRMEMVVSSKDHGKKRQATSNMDFIAKYFQN